MGTRYGRSPGRKFVSEPGGEFVGLYEAIVVNDQDPEKRGRVQVQVFDIHDDDFPVDQLPWATPNMPSAFVNKTTQGLNGGFFHIPPVDSLVNIMFRRGDPDYPVWIGGWFPFMPAITGRESYTSKEPRQALYNPSGIPSCPTWASLRGHRIEMDDQAAELRITTPAGHKITLSDSAANEHGDCIKLEDHAGNYIWMNTGKNLLSIFWAGDVVEHIGGSVNRTIMGDVKEKITGSYSRQIGVNLNDKITGQANIDSSLLYLNSGTAQPVNPTDANQGTTAGGDSVGKVLTKLGNVLQKIIVGSGS